MQPPCGAETFSPQVHFRPVFIGESPGKQIRVSFPAAEARGLSRPATPVDDLRRKLRSSRASAERVAVRIRNSTTSFNPAHAADARRRRSIVCRLGLHPSTRLLSDRESSHLPRHVAFTASRNRRGAVDSGAHPRRVLEALVDQLTRGDPTSPLRWTCKSRAKLAAALAEQGWRVSSTTVGRLLHRLGYRLQSVRKAAGRHGPSGQESPAVVVTAYRPDPLRWDQMWRRRRK